MRITNCKYAVIWRETFSNPQHTTAEYPETERGFLRKALSTATLYIITTSVIIKSTGQHQSAMINDKYTFG